MYYTHVMCGLKVFYKFAVLFGDEEIAKKILRSDSPKQQKSLGRKVSNFDEKMWNENCREIVRKGNMEKVKILK